MTTADDPSFLSATPDQVETGIAREIRKTLPVLDARDTAAIAMVPVRPVLEAQAEEIARLREKVASYENAITWNTSCTSCATVLDSSIAATFRAEQAEEKLAVAGGEERARCGRQIRAHAARLRGVATGLSGFMVAEATDRAADLIDPQGPVQGARAMGGTE